MLYDKQFDASVIRSRAAAAATIEIPVVRMLQEALALDRDLVKEEAADYNLTAAYQRLLAEPVTIDAATSAAAADLSVTESSEGSEGSEGSGSNSGNNTEDQNSNEEGVVAATADEYFADLAQLKQDNTVVEIRSENVFLTKPRGIEEVPKVTGRITDFSSGEEYELTDYLLESGGDACVFLYRGHLMGLSKTELSNSLRKGDRIYYECKRVFAYNPPDALGTFEPTDIKRERYIELNLNGRFYFRWNDIVKLFSTHALWMIDDTADVIPVSASRVAALTGGPIQSAHHCQTGTDKRIYKLTPIRFITTGTDLPEPAGSIVKIRRDGVDTELDVADSQSVGSVRTKYAEKAGVAADLIRLIYGGKELKDDDVVTPGSVILATIRSAGGTRRRQRSRHGRRTLKQRAA
jgi:hypothetical protein